MMLSPQQVDRIRHYVDDNDVRIHSLRDDMIDHLCCSVEIKIGEGKTFDDAFRESLNDLAPAGLKKLEYETIELLESKNIYMKKFIYLIGLFTSIGMTLGVTFKLLHWTGGDQLFNYSFILFGLLFLPMAAYNSYTANVRRTLVEKLRILFGFVSPILIGSAIVMKMLHLQGADVILLIGIGIFSFGFLPCLFYSMYAKSIKMTVQE